MIGVFFVNNLIQGDIHSADRVSRLHLRISLRVLYSNYNELYLNVSNTNSIGSSKL